MKRLGKLESANGQRLAEMKRKNKKAIPYVHIYPKGSFSFGKMVKAGEIIRAR
jgi:hypothetical protein